MTKKDYVIIANAIRKAKTPPIASEQMNMILHVQAHIINALKEENPKFNESKFWEACIYI